MDVRKNRPQLPESPDLPGVGKSQKRERRCSDRVISQGRNYKGGRTFAYAQRFRTWREVQGYSLAKMAARIENKTREIGMDGQYVLTRLYELEQGRFKPPTWLILLLMETYDIHFDWREFHE